MYHPVNNIFGNLWYDHIIDDLDYYAIVKYQNVFFIQHITKVVVDELCTKFGLVLNTPSTVLFGTGNKERDLYSQKNVTHTLKQVGYYIVGSAATHSDITKELKRILDSYNFLKGIEDLADYQFDTYPEHLI